MHVAIIGLGEVGRCYAGPLHEYGLELSLCESRPSAPARELASSLAVPIHSGPGTWLRKVDWVLSCVTAATAMDVVEQCIAHLGNSASIADFTTASPGAKQHAAQRAGEGSCRYIDVAVMGAISLNQIRTPLLASGAGAEDVKALLEPAGARVQVIAGGKAGDAAALKILRSVFTKGVEALSVELLMSAEKQGVREQLYEQLSDIDNTPLRSFLDMLVRTHVVHAKRRAHEVRAALDELSAQGFESVVLPGVEQRFLQTASKLESQSLGEAEPTVEQALQWLLANANA